MRLRRLRFEACAAKPGILASRPGHDPLSVDVDRSALLARNCLAAAAREAGELALGFFRHGMTTSAGVQSKSGGSPVTEADLAADALLELRLRAAYPDAGWLSEETADGPERLGRRSLIVVDPIDGTRAFVAGDPRWTVCAALVVDGRPIAGVVHAPALDETYLAARGAGALFNGAPVKLADRIGDDRFNAAGPKPILLAMSASLGLAMEIAPRVPSLAYRLCLAARGAIDVAVAAADSHDWDVAAADLVLEEAGGLLTDATGELLRYNSATVRRGPLLAASKVLAPKILSAFRAATTASRG
jgi:myo-inositol-1(or 4)-monophosphatase